MNILLDMDGVLADFHSAVCRLYGKQPWPFVWKPNNWNWFIEWGVTESDLAPHMDHDFYAGLDWTPDGREILERAEKAVGRDNVYFLTSPWDTPGCADGKRAWVRRHVPHYLPRTLIGTPKHLCSRPDCLLMDDSEKNCRKFSGVSKGGYAVLVPRPWNARHHEACFETGRVLDLPGLFDGYADGRPPSLDEYLRGKRSVAEPR